MPNQLNEKDKLVKKVQQAAEGLLSKKALDIKAHLVSGATLIADAFVFCSANSAVHLKAVANGAREWMRDGGYEILRVEGDHQSGWLILDYGDVIIHIFRAEARAFYELDKLWADTPEIPLALDIN
ncbi:MAG TPA: ribosome silencing factor [Candidatus Hydrogenedentes bacterium]|jgi:ribosome-associated protein|nr:MAG: Ribosomal silencing factor RsfS [Candidatus Hydrogenedentes bacterium ADurb.Bin170]HNZ48397.1 ribosome silencing factor [Candidatus Hydrogenedentota bacterium]HOD94548.1 ribosome silencing factor [Candidatus Hydrogenedentota bacterium]HOH41846.1 ribosome silencing factor [Candidatus Hydrogenedentota bacterium]HOR49924.1 ribosome silencing factor [Candidatus Hydrogenedentota bacterium]